MDIPLQVVWADSPDGKLTGFVCSNWRASDGIVVCSGIKGRSFNRYDGGFFHIAEGKAITIPLSRVWVIREAIQESEDNPVQAEPWSPDRAPSGPSEETCCNEGCCCEPSVVDVLRKPEGALWTPAKPGDDSVSRATAEAISAAFQQRVESGESFGAEYPEEFNVVTSDKEQPAEPSRGEVINAILRKPEYIADARKLDSSAYPSAYVKLMCKHSGVTESGKSNLDPVADLSVAYGAERVDDDGLSMLQQRWQEFRQAMGSIGADFSLVIPKGEPAYEDVKPELVAECAVTTDVWSIHTKDKPRIIRLIGLDERVAVYQQVQEPGPAPMQSYCEIADDVPTPESVWQWTMRSHKPPESVKHIDHQGVERIYVLAGEGQEPVSVPTVDDLIDCPALHGLVRAFEDVSDLRDAMVDEDEIAEHGEQSLGVKLANAENRAQGLIGKLHAFFSEYTAVEQK